jgi:nucleoside-diphosphate-sugar epimerase
MTTVLVASGTGMLGSRIADYLVKETGVQVRLLVRDGWEDDEGRGQRGGRAGLVKTHRPGRLAAAGRPGDLNRKLFSVVSARILPSRGALAH